MGKIKVFLVRVKNYTNGKFENLCYTVEEFLKEEKKFNDYITSIDSNQTKMSSNFQRVHPCGVMRYNDGAIDYNGDLYKCEHHLGQTDKRAGTCKSGWFYNNAYTSNANGIIDERCKSCVYYPRCGFALCVGLHSLSGDRSVCNYIPIMKARTDSFLEKYLKEV